MKDLTRKEERSPERQFLPLKLPLWTKIHNTSLEPHSLGSTTTNAIWLSKDVVKAGIVVASWDCHSYSWKTECLLGKITSMKHLVRKLCPTLLQPHGLQPPGSSVHGISQAKILEWITISFSRVSSQHRDQTHVFCTGRWILYHWATREAPSKLKHTKLVTRSTACRIIWSNCLTLPTVF